MSNLIIIVYEKEGNSNPYACLAISIDFDHLEVLIPIIEEEINKRLEWLGKDYIPLTEAPSSCSNAWAMRCMALSICLSVRVLSSSRRVKVRA